MSRRGSGPAHRRAEPGRGERWPAGGGSAGWPLSRALDSPVTARPASRSSRPRRPP